MEHLLLEGQKTKRKLQKVQQRRDHYARLYYQALMELDMMKLELNRAHKEISELKGQGRHAAENRMSEAVCEPMATSDQTQHLPQPCQAVECMSGRKTFTFSCMCTSSKRIVITFSPSLPFNIM